MSFLGSQVVTQKKNRARRFEIRTAGGPSTVVMTNIEERRPSLVHSPWVPMVIVGLALACRLLAVSAGTDLLIHDEITYVKYGREIADGSGSFPTFYQPLYLAFLASIFKLFGPGLLAARIAQSLLGALTTWLVYRVGTELFDRSVGLVAAVIIATFPEIVGFTALFYTENLFLPIFVLALLLTCRALRSPSAIGACAGAGLAFGFAMLTRQIDCYFALAVAGFVTVVPAATTRARWLRASAYLSPLLLVGGLWMTVNYARVGHFVLTTNQWNLLLAGNHRAEDLTGYASIKDDAEREAYARDRALDEIWREQPQWILRKVDTFVSQMWTPRNFVFRQADRNGSSKIAVWIWFAISSLFLAVLIVGGVIGICVAPADARRVLLVSLLVYMSLVHLATDAVSRHRLPYVPILAVYAAFLLVRARTMTAVLPRTIPRARIAVISVVLACVGWGWFRFFASVL